MSSTNNTLVLMQYLYQDIQYFIVSRNNKIFAVCYEKDKIRINFKPYEKDLALKVYSSFLIDEKSSVKVDNIKIKNHQYSIFYDPKHRNYYWKNKNSEFESNPLDNAILNMKYNNQTAIHYSKKGDSKELSSDKFFKKIVTFGCSTIIVFALATMALIPSSQSINISYEQDGKVLFNQEFFDLSEDEKSSKYKEMLDKKSEKTAVYDSEIIADSINKNENLSNEEKEFLSYFSPILEEHKEYIDFNFLTVRLNTLNILYPQINMSSISGEYDEFNNVISMFNYDDQIVSNFQETNKLDLTHEIGHVFSPNNSGLLHECSNEAWARSVNDKLYLENKVSSESYTKNKDGNYVLQGGGYQGFIPFYYILTEFMTPEEILQFQYSSDISIIGNALINIDKEYGNNKDTKKITERAYSLLSRMDNKFKNQSDLYSKDDYNYILKELNYYYKVKNGQDLYDDLNMFVLLNSIPLYDGFLKEVDLSYYQENDIEKRKQIFSQIIREELAKNTNLTIDKNFDINNYLVSYPDIFLKKSTNNNVIIYINNIPISQGNNEQKKEASFELEITPEIYQKFEKMCIERNLDMENNR